MATATPSARERLIEAASPGYRGCPFINAAVMSAAYLDRDPTLVDHARHGAEELLRRHGGP